MRVQGSLEECKLWAHKLGDPSTVILLQEAWLFPHGCGELHVGLGSVLLWAHGYHSTRGTVLSTSTLVEEAQDGLCTESASCEPTWGCRIHCLSCPDCWLPRIGRTAGAVPLVPLQTPSWLGDMSEDDNKLPASELAFCSDMPRSGL